MFHLLIIATSITGKGSVIDKPSFHYSHHQAVAGLIFDVLIILCFLGWGAYVAYTNFGPPAKRRAAAAD